MSRDLQEYKIKQGEAALLEAYVILHDKVRITLKETGNSTVAIDHILNLLSDYSNYYIRNN